MKVLFVYPVPPAKWQILRYQQGLGSISAVLKQAGHSTTLLTLSDLDRAAIDRTVKQFQPDLVGISLTSSYFPLSKDLARTFAADYKLPVILGGVHPTLRPEESIAADGVFAICVGEGEYPMLELCEALQAGRDPTRIPNLWVKHNGQVHKNEIRPLIADLDALPFPDRELFDFQTLLAGFAEAEFMGSRGCPYRCTYCANHALFELYKGKGSYIRFRSVKNLLDEVEQVTKRYKDIALLGFHDDTFTLNPKWLQEFAETYPKRFSFPFWCNATARSINERNVAWLKAAGCYEVRIGVESGNDRIRMEMLDKRVTREEIVRAFRLLREADILTYAFNMIGLPSETPETINDTIRLNQEIRPHAVFCSIFFPFPGTKSFEICRERGWITGQTVKSYFESDYALNQPTITRKQILFYHDIFRDLIRWPRLDPLIRTLHRIPVGGGKTAWNAIRRVRAKLRELGSRITGRPLTP